MQLDLVTAREHLACFRALIDEHIRIEEDVLLPLYRRAGEVPGGSEALFTGEHRKIREFLASFEKRLDEIEREGATHRRVLALLDRQATFKNLMEHHDLREDNIFYPKLDEVVPEPERGAIFAEIKRRAGSHADLF